jgi:hypothetical protein
MMVKGANAPCHLHTKLTYKRRTSRSPHAPVHSINANHKHNPHEHERPQGSPPTHPHDTRLHRVAQRNARAMQRVHVLLGQPEGGGGGAADTGGCDKGCW